jgi:hypothetical protein
MLSPHCGCVVALSHVEKHFVCLEVAGASTTTPTCHGPLTVFSPEEERPVHFITAQSTKKLSSGCSSRVQFPITDVRLVDLPRKIKFCFVTETDFLTGMFHLLQYGPPCSRKIQNVSTCCLVLRVATLAVVKAGEQGVFEEFSTHLAVVHSTRGSPNVLTALDFTDKPAEQDKFSPHSYSVGLNSSPYRCNLYLQTFYTTF